MLTNNEIIALVQADIPGYSSSSIVTLMNAALKLMASELQLPLLHTSDTVQTHSDAIEGVTLVAGSAVSINATAHGLTSGQRVRFASAAGTTELNGNMYTITVTDANNFTLDGTDSTNFTAWTSGGYFYRPHVALPTNYHRGLHGYRISGSVYSKARGRLDLDVYTSWALFKSHYEDLNNSGSIQAVCVQGDRLWYQYIPATADTLTLDYWRAPTASEANDTAPDGVPEGGDMAIANWVTARIFKRTGEHEMAAVFEGEFNRWFEDMKELYGGDDTLSETVPDHSNYI